MKSVTIVIPSFNQAKYLPACVDHCLFQTYPNIEIIIVDGGSTDGTKDFLSTLKQEIVTRKCNPVDEMDSKDQIIRNDVLAYPQNRTIQIITFNENIGPTRTYNEGFKRASGVYCTYIVGDDMPHPYMIEELVAALESSGTDFAYSDMNLVDDTGRIVRQMRLPDYSFESCFARWYHLGVSHLYKTEWHKKVGLMDESYEGANDYDHYLRFAMAGCKFHHVPKVLYSIRHHGEVRKTGQHSDGRYANLIQESKRCAGRARDWLTQIR